MKIVIKLALLVVGSLGLLALAVVVYGLILSPIDQMEKERGLFKNASTSCLQLQVTVNRIMTEDLGVQKQAVREASAVYLQALKNISEITLLPTINQTIKDAVTTVAQLAQLSETSLADVAGGLEKLDKSAAALFEQPGSASVTGFWNLQADEETAPELANARFSVNILANAIKDLNQSLEATAVTIGQKDKTIEEEIQTIRVRSVAIATVAVVLILILSLFLSFLVSRSIVLSLGGLMSTIQTMATGDLRGRFSVHRRDEIGQLGRDLEELLGMFHQVLAQIVDASRQNAEVREDLISSVSEATSSSVEIQTNTDSIRNQMEVLDGKIEVSTGSMDAIGRAISAFRLQLEEQNLHVGDSVSAVTQMMASIENISRIANADRKAADELVQVSDRGKAIFDDAFEKVAQISSNIEVIQEMSGVIGNIAAQTNILALNAAIEAAHAGEFGKGFAVVADEISKLAAASAASSGEIEQSIHQVIQKIHEAALTKSSSTEAFDAISSKIQTVSESINEIYANVQEMQLGSRQILESMEGLKNGSSLITGRSGEIEGESQGVQSTISDIGRISHEVVSNIGEIVHGLGDITKSVRDIASRSDRIAEAGITLDTAVGRFLLPELEAPSRG